ncbi:putative transcription factor homeobox-WOX family [Helianthus annuus]|nr:putative transcription factor homeobox-WOX family [Helianthus annuus]
MNNGKYVRFTPKHCPKPSSQRRQLIHECLILSNIKPKQIKVWFQNQRLRPHRKMYVIVSTFNTILTTSVK